MWPQMISDPLDILHACLYTAWALPKIFLKFKNYICGHSIGHYVFSIELSKPNFAEGSPVMSESTNMS